MTYGAVPGSRPSLNKMPCSALTVTGSATLFDFIFPFVVKKGRLISFHMFYSVYGL